MDADSHKHFLKPEQEVRNYFLALNYRCAKLTANGFLIPNIVKERIRSYSLSKFAKKEAKQILKRIAM